MNQENNKYTPEWFAEKAKEKQYDDLREKEAIVRKEFRSKFDPEKLSELKGIDLLRAMFYSDVDNKSNLCYMLEHNAQIKMFGGIGGGSAFKYGLFYHSKLKTWITGSPVKKEILTEDKAIEIGTKIRDELVEGAKIISRYKEHLKDKFDYENLYHELQHLSLIDKVWVLKYYQMIFPEIFPVFYGKDIQCNLIKFIGEIPSEHPIVRMGQINIFVKACGIPSTTFGKIYGEIISDNDDSDVETDNVLSDGSTYRKKYWIYSAGDNSCMWEDFYEKGIMAIGWSEIGDLAEYDSRKQMKEKMQNVYDPNLSYMNATLATWQFANEIQIGDVVFVKRGRNTIIGRGIVESEYYFDETISNEFKNVREVNWTHSGEWTHPGNAPVKTLTEVTSYVDYVEKLNDLFMDSDESVRDEIVTYPSYTEADFLKEVYMDDTEYHVLTNILKKKKNIILQGAPGVGKTFAAKRLAYSIMGKCDKDRVMMIQFHQSYSYEDFIMGFRPAENGFELKTGAFYNFCKKAQDDKENDYFFIIDEINRGNLSKIFGELFMLIEADKRGVELQLLYSDEKFSVPSNVYIIGMMNTADRSLAMLDYALRRRFAFFEMKPGFESDGFREYRMHLNSVKFDKLIDTIERLNEAIVDDDSLGDGFCIGHSFFCNLKNVDADTLSAIVEYEIIPLLKEYWFDDSRKVKDWSNSLRSSIK